MNSRIGPRGQNALGAVLILLALIVLAGFAYAGLMLRAPPTDAETLCRSDGSVVAHTIVLVDSTDRLEPRHRRKLSAVLDQERARLSQYERITVIRLNARRPQEPVILFSKCLPRPPENANPLFENPRQRQEHWDTEFADALARALRTAQSGSAQRASPIPSGLARGRGRSRFRRRYPPPPARAGIGSAGARPRWVLPLCRRRRLRRMGGAVADGSSGFVGN